MMSDDDRRSAAENSQQLATPAREVRGRYLSITSYKRTALP
jgi:hypothetical protein